MARHIAKSKVKTSSMTGLFFGWGGAGEKRERSIVLGIKKRTGAGNSWHN